LLFGFGSLMNKTPSKPLRSFGGFYLPWLPSHARQRGHSGHARPVAKLREAGGFLPIAAVFIFACAPVLVCCI
jgi:hypothetical protein